MSQVSVKKYALTDVTTPKQIDVHDFFFHSRHMEVIKGVKTFCLIRAGGWKLKAVHDASFSQPIKNYKKIYA